MADGFKWNGDHITTREELDTKIEAARTKITEALRIGSGPAEYQREMAARAKASDAYHDDPSHATSCRAYTAHQRDMGRKDLECPCEDDWSSFMAES